MTKIIVVASGSRAPSARRLPPIFHRRKARRPSPGPSLPGRSGPDFFYVGLDAGYTWSNADTVARTYWDTDAAGLGANALIGHFLSSINASVDGFIGGGQIGFSGL